jgi:Flp pilus assembly protein TadB
MSTLSIFLNILSTVCSMAALSVFVYWIGQKVSSSYESGRVLLDVSGEGHGFKVQGVPLARWINDAAVALMPVVESWRKRDRFEIRRYLAEWDIRLTQGGLRHRISPEQFLSFCLLSGLVMATVGVGFTVLIGMGPIGCLMIGLLPGAAAGLLLPPMILRNFVLGRVSLIEKRLPFAIEFMLLAMQASAAFSGALQTYCEQMASDPLADELRAVLKDLDMGTDLKFALSNMANRIGSDDVTAFVLAVNNGLSCGQEIEKVLMDQADATRNRRYESAETVAKTASTRAIFPLFFVAIAIMLLLVGPLAVKLWRESLF